MKKVIAKKTAIRASVNDYEIVDYFDVWGNPEDGFEVNDLSRTGEIVTIDDSASEDDVIDGLIRVGYLRPDAKGRVSVDLWGDGYIELVEDETGMPIGRLEAVRASRRSSGRRVMAARNAKKIEVYVVQEYTGYGNGWEDIAQYPDTSSDSLRQAKQDVKDYRDNGYQARIITRRVDNPDYIEPANEITYDEAVAWVESCPYDVSESYFSAGKNYVLSHEGDPWSFAQIYIDEDNTVSVRNIRGNRTKQVRSIAELEKEVNRLANL